MVRIGPLCSSCNNIYLEVSTFKTEALQTKPRHSCIEITSLSGTVKQSCCSSPVNESPCNLKYETQEGLISGGGVPNEENTFVGREPNEKD